MFGKTDQDSSSDGWEEIPARSKQVMPNGSSRAEKDTSPKIVDVCYESNDNAAAFVFERRETRRSIDSHSHRPSANEENRTAVNEMKPFAQSVKSFLPKETQPTKGTPVCEEIASSSKEFGSNTIDYYQREQKLAILKDVHDGKMILAGKEFEGDSMLLDMLLYNLDFVTMADGFVVATTKYSDVHSSLIPWRAYDHAVFYDLMEFIRNIDDLPKMAAAVTFLEPHLLLCTAHYETFSNRRIVQQTVESLLETGIELVRAKEIFYGSKLLWRHKDADNKDNYFRVATLAVCNNLGFESEKWMIISLDGCLSPQGERVFPVAGAELFSLPEECYIEQIPPHLFIVKLRGLEHIKEGFIEVARDALQQYLLSKPDKYSFVLPVGYDEESGAPIIDLLYIDVKNEELATELLSQVLYDIEIQTKGDNTFWVTKDGNNKQLPPIPDFEDHFQKILNDFIFEPSDLQISGTMTQDLIGEESSQECLLKEEAISDPVRNWPESEEKVEESKYELMKWKKYQEVLHAILSHPDDQRLVKCVFKLCKENSRVIDEDYEFFLSFFPSSSC